MVNPPLLLIAGLETTLNQYLRLDPDILPRVAALSGKVIGLELIFSPGDPATGARASLTLYLLPGPEGIQVLDHYAGAPDVLIRGTPLALASLRRSRISSAGGAEVEIVGDTQLGKTFKDLLDNMDIDWEEHLSRLVGDTIAHQVGSTLRNIFSWGQRTIDTLSRDLGEYLHEESRNLPQRKAVEDFLDAVDVLRSDTDRLEARIRRLQQARTGKPSP